ncbi:hypothetical protein QBC33DRAFT_563630 [Phialemonium atrogriseum]|uniref:Mid2 domain-containing protein n=1 Tax=Phialemonium atrogriseum TaxID=1093897 RepID=A0AAJ0FGS2_9PEZI|nr:uncharacterized protein QBC33DRAFT_563630 [Phialemonium atrogriseum]KAK1762643.1 hypothetical protein QBC33DRAFT_563630 [Phialemonium atrogriseum]
MSIRAVIFLILLFTRVCMPSPAVTSHPATPTFRRHNDARIDKRAVTRLATELSTCGYLNGDPKLPRTADRGYNCRVDTQNGLWGFCPTSVLVASDCGLAGSCEDHHGCSDGCGLTDKEDLTTFTCDSKAYCSTALLTFGVDQTYSYIACGAGPSTDHYLISPTAVAESASTPTTTSRQPSTTNSATESEHGSTSSSQNLEPSVPSSIPSSSGTAPATASSDHSSSNTGFIVGGVIGGLALLCAFGIAAIYLLRRGHGRQQSADTVRRQTDHHPLAVEEQKPHRLAGGWGPQELSDHGNPAARSPVELAG